VFASSDVAATPAKPRCVHDTTQVPPLKHGDDGNVDGDDTDGAHTVAVSSTDTRSASLRIDRRKTNVPGDSSSASVAADSGSSMRVCAATPCDSVHSGDRNMTEPSTLLHTVLDLEPSSRTVASATPPAALPQTEPPSPASSTALPPALVMGGGDGDGVPLLDVDAVLDGDCDAADDSLAESLGLLSGGGLTSTDAEGDDEHDSDSDSLATDELDSESDGDAVIDDVTDGDAD
jgi:hypothetical protein